MTNINLCIIIISLDMVYNYFTITVQKTLTTLNKDFNITKKVKTKS